jgi:hypothetical protein
MPCPSHPPRFDHFNNVWRGVQVMKLISMQFPPLHSSSVQIFSSAPCSQTPSVYVPPLMLKVTITFKSDFLNSFRQIRVNKMGHDYFQTLIHLHPVYIMSLDMTYLYKWNIVLNYVVNLNINPRFPQSWNNNYVKYFIHMKLPLLAQQRTVNKCMVTFNIVL